MREFSRVRFEGLLCGIRLRRITSHIHSLGNPASPSLTATFWVSACSAHIQYSAQYNKIGAMKRCGSIQCTACTIVVSRKNLEHSQTRHCRVLSRSISGEAEIHVDVLPQEGDARYLTLVAVHRFQGTRADCLGQMSFQQLDKSPEACFASFLHSSCQTKSALVSSTYYRPLCSVPAQLLLGLPRKVYSVL